MSYKNHKTGRYETAVQHWRLEIILAILLLLVVGAMAKYEKPVYGLHSAQGEYSPPRVQVSDLSHLQRLPAISKRLESHIKARPDTWRAISDKFGKDKYVAGELIARESGFNSRSINPSSGACGLPQALPCAKMGCNLDDVNCQLEWMEKYVNKRYGSWENAVKFHDERNWY